MALKDFLGDYGTMAKLPEVAGKYKGMNLVIVGDAIGVWNDLERFGCRMNFGRGSVSKNGWQFLTVNKAVETFPGIIEHSYCNEPNLLRKFTEARRPEYAREFSGPHHSHSITAGAKWVWPFGGHGTSGLGACLVAIGLGYDKIVLCGLPLDNGPHNGEPHWRKCAFETSEAAPNVATGINSHWKKARDMAFEGKIKSTSGRTKEWLGGAENWV